MGRRRRKRQKERGKRRGKERERGKRRGKGRKGGTLDADRTSFAPPPLCLPLPALALAPPCAPETVKWSLGTGKGNPSGRVPGVHQRESGAGWGGWKCVPDD